MNRRGFLKSSLVLGAGLVVGAEALEAMERLTHQRKTFAMGFGFTDRMAEAQRVTAAEIIKQQRHLLEKLRREFTSTLYYGQSRMLAHEFSGLTVVYEDKGAGLLWPRSIQ